MPLLFPLQQIQNSPFSTTWIGRHNSWSPPNVINEFKDTSTIKFHCKFTSLDDGFIEIKCLWPLLNSHNLYQPNLLEPWLLLQRSCKWMPPSPLQYQVRISCFSFSHTSYHPWTFLCTKRENATDLSLVFLSQHDVEFIYMRIYYSVATEESCLDLCLSPDVQTLCVRERLRSCSFIMQTSTMF